MKSLRTVIVVLCVIMLVSTSVFAAEKTKENVGTGKAGLMVIAHGAPDAKWNKPVLDLEPEILKALGKDSPFSAVKVAMMEFTEPSIATIVKQLEDAGCDQIIAVPLLIAPSSHSHWDVPALLGHYIDNGIKQILEEEDAEIVRTKLPITVTATLSQGNILLESMLDRVKELSRNPDEEAVVILAHGDDMMKPFWCSLMKRIACHVCGKTGITYANWAFIHMGQHYSGTGVPVIYKAGEQRKRVLVVGCYISFGVSRVHKRYMKRPKFIPGMGELPNPLEGKDIIVSDCGLLPDPRVVKWIIQTAESALMD